MDFTAIPLFTTMKAKMGYLSERQGVLAQNIANADTPHYRAKDIKTPDFKALAMGMQTGTSHRLPMAVTKPGHITGDKNASTSFMVTQRESTYELNPNDNNVVIEEEMMRVAENQAEYQKVLSLYRKSIDMFKTAIGRPGSGG